MLLSVKKKGMQVLANALMTLMKVCWYILDTNSVRQSDVWQAMCMRNMLYF